MRGEGTPELVVPSRHTTVIGPKQDEHIWTRFRHDAAEFSAQINEHEREDQKGRKQSSVPTPRYPYNLIAASIGPEGRTSR